jgi:hypothetical protein
MSKQKIKALNDVPAIHTYLTRIGAEARSLRTAVVKEMHGAYWKDLATISFSKDGKVETKATECLPTEEEQKRIEEEIGEWDWPSLKLLIKPKYPREVSEHPPENIFEFRSMSGELIMLQLRIDVKGGDKKYVPWTYWDDDEWRAMEPDGMLPLWGLDQLKNFNTAFIHEGAKAARAVRTMIEANTAEARARLAEHPWAEELSHAAHLGWIGGALSPTRTDWSAIKKAGIYRAYIVSDNDSKGVSAVPSIAQRLRIQTFQLQFTSEWPLSFDLADEFPAKMFKKIEGKRYYSGPSFRSCLHPATWATDTVPQAKGKPLMLLRDNFKDMWAYIEEADLYVCTEMPEILRSEPIANKMLAPFSHTNNTTQLIVRSYTGRSARLCYRPDVKGRLVTDRGTSAINLHSPGHVKSTAGNIDPFLSFMLYMFPNEEERRQMLRWVATLVAHPETRMEYGVLLVSEKTGIGKTTLGSQILAPLVGHHNTGFPNESDIVDSNFNGWLAHKRLVVIQEIYSGHSWKAYNKLKSFITDTDVQVNEKFQRTYVIDNWCHFYACSNSSKALKIEDDDRRWLVPEVNEERWAKKKFDELYSWLKSGGLGIIRNWAEQWPDPVAKGERAPMTDRKKEYIADSRSDAEKEVSELGRELASLEQPAGLCMSAIQQWAKMTSGGRIFETDMELRRVMKETGVEQFKTKVKVGGRLQVILMNAHLTAAVDAEGDLLKKAIIIREHLKSPNDILGSLM